MAKSQIRIITTRARDLEVGDVAQMPKSGRFIPITSLEVRGSDKDHTFIMLNGTHDLYFREYDLVAVQQVIDE